MSGRGNSAKYVPSHLRGARAQGNSAGQGSVAAQASGDSRGNGKTDGRNNRRGGNERTRGGQRNDARPSARNEAAAGTKSPEQLPYVSSTQGSWRPRLRWADVEDKPEQQDTEPHSIRCTRKHDQLEYSSSAEAHKQSSGSSASCLTQIANLQRQAAVAARDPDAPACTYQSAVAASGVFDQPDWQKVSAMPNPRHGLAIAVADGIVYCIGGFTAEAQSSAVERYMDGLGWDSACSLPSPRPGLAATALAGSVYVAGGIDEMGFMTRGAWCMNVRHGAVPWRVLPAMHAPRADLALVAHDCRVYAIGGTGVPFVEIFDIEDQSAPWAVIMPGLQAPRTRLAAVSIGGVLYAMGGMINGAASSCVETFDTRAANCKWATAQHMPSPRYSFGAAAICDRHICIAGGFGISPLADVHCLDTTTQKWSQKAALPMPMWHLALASIVDGSVMVFGGLSRDFPLAAVHRLSVASEKVDKGSGSVLVCGDVSGDSPVAVVNRTTVDTGSGDMAQQRCGSASCKYLCTWHQGHCCKRCMITDGREHGKKCDRLFQKEAAGEARAAQTRPASSSARAAQTRPASSSEAMLGAPSAAATSQASAAAATTTRSPCLQEWQQITAMPTVRHSMAVAITETAVYCIGGATAGQPSAVVERYWETWGWDSTCGLPSPRHGLAAAALPGSIYVAGGCDDSGRGTNTAWRMNLRRKKEWKNMAPLQVPRQFLALIGHEKHIYAIGGADVALVESFCVEDVWGSWVSAPGLQVSKTKLAALALGDVLYSLGGMVNGKAVSSVEALNTRTMVQWTAIESMMTPRYSFGAAAISAQHICVAGGCSVQHVLLSSVECFDTMTHTWSRAAPLPDARSRLALAGSKDGSVLVFGGAREGSATATVLHVKVLHEIPSSDGRTSAEDTQEASAEEGLGPAANHGNQPDDGYHAPDSDLHGQDVVCDQQDADVNEPDAGVEIDDDSRCCFRSCWGLLLLALQGRRERLAE